MNLLMIMSIILWCFSSAGKTNSTDINHGNNQNNVIEKGLKKNSIKHRLETYRELLDNSQNFDKITNFIKQNKEWPVYKLRVKAEKLAITATAKSVAQWFRLFPPLTGEGYKTFAIKYFEFNKYKDCDRKIMQEGWIKGIFNPKEEAAYLKKYGRFLTITDHNKKITELIWQEDFEAATRLLHLVSVENQKRFKLAISLLKDEPNAPQLFTNTKKSALLNYAYLQSHKKKLLTPEIYKVLEHDIKDEAHASSIAKIRFYYAREFFSDNRYQEAYSIVKTNHSKDNVDIMESEWFAGWIALRFLHKTDIALQHFKNMYKVTKKPIGSAKAAYWIARAYKMKKNIKEAKLWFQKSAEYGYPFYSLLSQEELKFKTIKFSKITKPYKTETNETTEVIKLLLQENRQDLAENFGTHLIQNSSSEENIMSALNTAIANKNYYILVKLAKEANFKGIIIPQYLFPVPKHNVKECFVPLSLAYAIVRHESEFDPYVIAKDEGIGLMQLMPETAHNVGKQLGEKCDLERLVRDAGYNIKFGSKHLKEHLNHYGSYILAIPSYNAGREKVNKWIDKFNDPRKMKNIYDIIDWLESIPFGRTREYVMRVLENYTIYKLIINNDNTLNIHNDLRYIK